MRVDWCVSSWLRYQEYSLTFSPCSPPAPHSPLALEHLATETQPSKGGGQFLTSHMFFFSTRSRWTYWSRMQWSESTVAVATAARYQSDVSSCVRLKSGCGREHAAARAQASEAMTKAEATVGWISSSPAGGALQLLMWELAVALSSLTLCSFW